MTWFLKDSLCAVSISAQMLMAVSSQQVTYLNSVVMPDNEDESSDSEQSDDE